LVEALAKVQDCLAELVELIDAELDADEAETIEAPESGS